MSLTMTLLIGIVLGLIVGVIFNILNSSFINDHIVGGFFAMIGTMFVNALKMLVVFSLICGVTGIGDIRVLGRVGGKSFALYLFTTAVAIALAIVIAMIIGPGAGFNMVGVDTSGVTGKEAPTVWEVIAAIVPTNPVAAFANGEMLQIIFDVMPELHWTVGYPAALSLMLASGALPLWFFRRRGWI